MKRTRESIETEIRAREKQVDRIARDMQGASGRAAEIYEENHDSHLRAIVRLRNELAEMMKESR